MIGVATALTARALMKDKVAAGSNDPIYVSPSRMIDASSELILPAAAYVQGVGGTQWKSDVWVMNVGSEPAKPNFELWPQGGGDPISATTGNQSAWNPT